MQPRVTLNIDNNTNINRQPALKRAILAPTTVPTPAHVPTFSPIIWKLVIHNNHKKMDVERATRPITNTTSITESKTIVIHATGPIHQMKSPPRLTIRGCASFKFTFDAAKAVEVPAVVGLGPWTVIGITF